MNKYTDEVLDAAAQAATDSSAGINVGHLRILIIAIADRMYRDSRGDAWFQVPSVDNALGLDGREPWCAFAEEWRMLLQVARAKVTRLADGSLHFKLEGPPVVEEIERLRARVRELEALVEELGHSSDNS